MDVHTVLRGVILAASYVTLARTIGSLMMVLGPKYVGAFLIIILIIIIIFI